VAEAFTRSRRFSTVWKPLTVNSAIGIALRVWRAHSPFINQAKSFGVSFQPDPQPRLDSKNKKGTMFFLCSYEEAGMLKTFVEEAAALASITLFVGMIAVWAQLIPQF
jgi:hypothetical protein